MDTNDTPDTPETSDIPDVPAPTSVQAGVTPDWSKLRVVDTSTDQPIAGVMVVDAGAGTVTRCVHDAAGNLIIENNVIKTVTEDRAVRVEWTPPVDPAAEPSA